MQEKRLFSEFEKPGKEQWQHQAAASLKGKPLAKLTRRSYEGIAIEPIYFEEDYEKYNTGATDLPGYYPFLRDGSLTGSKLTPFEIVQDMNCPTPELVNAALRQDLNYPGFAVNIIADKASRCGFNPGARAAGDGTSIFSLNDFEILFKEIDPRGLNVYLYSDCRAMPLAALLAAYIEKHNINSPDVRGGLLFDPLERFERTGYINDPAARIFDAVAESMRFTIDRLPGFTGMSINGVVYASAGATAEAELAFVMAKAILYIREMSARGIDVNDSAPAMTLSLAIGQNFFMEIAKFRAARMLWARVIKEFGGSTAAQTVRIHAFAGGINKTSLDHYNNVLRNSTEAVSAILGGAGAIHLRNFDECTGCPPETSRRMTRNILNVLRDECNLGSTIDPAGGAWYVESLTAQLARKAWELVQVIETKGGWLGALCGGFPQDYIKPTAQARLSAMETRRDALIGANKFPNIYEEYPAAGAYDLDAISMERAAALGSIQGARDNAALGKALTAYHEAGAAGSNNRHKALVDCILAGATIGELTFYTGNEELSKINFPEFAPIRLSGGFEKLRANALSYKSRTGHYPKVYLAAMGALGQYKPRADFAADAFLTGGFEPVSGLPCPDVADAAMAAIASGAPVIVICSSDDLYPEFVPAFTKYIKDHTRDRKAALKVILAGYPADHVDQFLRDGVDGFVHIKANIYELMTKLQRDLEIQ